MGQHAAGRKRKSPLHYSQEGASVAWLRGKDKTKQPPHLLFFAAAVPGVR